MTNQEIAKVLREIGEHLEMKNVPFKPRAYEKAAETIGSLSEEVGALYERGGIKALKEIPGVGVAIAEKIEELLKTGKLKYYEALKRSMPVNLGELTTIAGLGPKKIKALYEKLGVKNIKDLETKAKAGKIAPLEGFGKKSEENILKGVSFFKSLGGRFLLGEILPEVRLIEDRLKSLKEVDGVTIAGSIRRRKETIGDADLLVISKKPAGVMDVFVRMPDVERVLAHGPTKSAVQMKSGLQIDLRVVPKESYGAALAYFTGSKDHNVAMREIAIKKGLKLNEYGLFSAKGGSASGGKGTKMVAGKTEEEIYKALGLHYVEPELREMRGELEASIKNNLPNLIGYNDLKGDLQVQTNWTDGSASIEEMAKAAIEIGLEYIVITDHTKRLAMTHGLDEKRIKEQWKEIDKVNVKFKNQSVKFRILKGTECDILKNGSLDLPDNILKQLDVVGVSVHSFFDLPRKEQTERVIKAIKNPNVDILFHPTGRLIEKRKAIDLDMEKIIGVAKETGTILEIDGAPDRLDLNDEYIKRCVERGVKMSIDSDAHAPDHFKFLEYGIAQARRGWAQKKDIINAWPLLKMLSFLK